MPRKKKKKEPETDIFVEMNSPICDNCPEDSKKHCLTPGNPGPNCIDTTSVVEKPIVDVEKVKLQIFKDSIAMLVEQAPRVIDVKDNPMLYGEFLNTLRRSLT